jgi:hypothetical protein
MLDIPIYLHIYITLCICQTVYISNYKQFLFANQQRIADYQSHDSTPVVGCMTLSFLANLNIIDNNQ